MPYPPELMAVEMVEIYLKKALNTCKALKELCLKNEHKISYVFADMLFGTLCNARSFSSDARNELAKYITHEGTGTDESN